MSVQLIPFPSNPIGHRPHVKVESSFGVQATKG